MSAGWPFIWLGVKWLPGALKGRKNSLSGYLKNCVGQAIIITKNREKNVLIINAPPIALMPLTFVLFSFPGKGESQRGIGG